MTRHFKAAMLRRMRALYRQGSHTQHAVWRLAPKLGAGYLLEAASEWPFGVDDAEDRETLVSRMATAIENDEIS